MPDTSPFIFAIYLIVKKPFTSLLTIKARSNTSSISETNTNIPNHRHNNISRTSSSSD